MSFKDFFISFKKVAIPFILATFLIILDRFLKNYALITEYKINLIPNWLQFSFIKNYYIAFSIPISGIFLNLLILGVLIILIWQLLIHIKKQHRIESSLLFFVILGASSNLFDRFSHGFVIDYIDLKYFSVFNIADAMISCSLLFFILRLHWLERKKIKFKNNHY